MKIILLVTSLFLSLISLAQQHYILKIQPVIGGSYHDMNNVGSTSLGNKIKLDHFDYYLSKLSVTHDGGQVLDLSDSVFLVTPDNYMLDLGLLNVNQVEQIHFGVGVPGPLNHLDISTYPENHPLSFQEPSMHWGWSEGYMHMIIGGLVDGDNDEVPEQWFELHNLGDNNYHEIDLPVYEYTESNGSHIITVSCNIDTWIGNINLVSVDSKHGSIDENAQILNNVVARSVFTSQQAYLGLKNAQTGNFTYSVNPTSIIVNAKEVSYPDHYELVNANGQMVYQGKLNASDFSLEFTNLKKGIYFFNVFSVNERIHQLKMIF